MFAVSREPGIKNRRDRDVEIGRFRVLAVLRVVESALQIIDFRTDVNSPGKCAEGILMGIKRGKTGQSTQGEIHLGNIALRAEILDTACKHRIELGGIDKMKESALRIGA